MAGRGETILRVERWRPTIFHGTTLHLSPGITWKPEHVPTEPIALEKKLKNSSNIFSAFNKKEEGGRERETEIESGASKDCKILRF